MSTQTLPSTRVLRVWNKLTRYQHHSNFLQTCLESNRIPKGFFLKFNLALVTENLELQLFCRQTLNKASQEICGKVHEACLAKCKQMQRELQTVKSNLFNEMDNARAQNLWSEAKHEQHILRNHLSQVEHRKFLNTILIHRSNDTRNPSNINGSTRRVRRFRKQIRQRNKRRNDRARRNDNPEQYTTSNLDYLDPINISDADITPDQTSLLRKGPSFCPTPNNIDWLQVHDDIEKFETRLRRAVYFMDKPISHQSSNQTSNLPYVANNSSWKPPKSKHPELELFLNNVKNDIVNPDNFRSIRDNLTKGERDALHDLPNTDLVIRIQDKGSRFVLTSEADYIDKMDQQLCNPLHYQQLPLDPAVRHLAMVQNWCDKWLQKGEITSKISAWVLKNASKVKPGVAFGNVKTHKARNPLRLITSCCGTIIENLSAFTEHYLKPLAQKLPSYLKNTTDLLNKIENLNNSGPFPQGTMLVSWDVVSMFPNIDNNLGIGAVRKALDSRDICRPSTECILEAVEICLNSNHSFFNGKYYLQTHGTAMGPKNACSYADIAMGEIDFRAKYGGEIKPLLWWRYRDDIFDLWKQGLNNLNSFTEYINSLYPTIKFELVYSETHLNVLDVTLHLIDGYIRTDVYSKPTDSHLYLPPSSAHPRHICKAIPFGVATRIVRNCSHSEFLNLRLNEYKGYLLEQGYNPAAVNEGFNKAALVPRTDLLRGRSNQGRNVFPLVLNYNPRLSGVNAVIKKHMHLIESSPSLKELFPHNSIISSFRRGKTLKEILAPSKFKPSTPYQTNPIIRPGCWKCDRTRCDLCHNFLLEATSFTSYRTGKRYYVKHKLDCCSSNIVYLVSCKRCKAQYVGSTTTEFKIRFRNHKSSMRTKKTTCEVAVHYNLTPHELSDFTFQCIDQVASTTNAEQVESVLITKEAYWSAQLFTIVPYGLNKRLECHSKNRINYR